jgi:hypothetical protein
MPVSTKRVIAFIPPMLLLQKESLPEGPEWLYEIKLDGYRAIAIKSGLKSQMPPERSNSALGMTTTSPSDTPRFPLRSDRFQTTR